MSTRPDDLAILAAHGMTGTDAQSALRHVYAHLVELRLRLSDFDGWTGPDLMATFGSDAGRAAVILARHTQHQSGGPIGAAGSPTDAQIPNGLHHHGEHLLNHDGQTYRVERHDA